MRIYVGLGNPGSEYKQTRHNFGFDVIDALAKKTGAKLKKSKFEADIAEFILADEKLLLVKPMTFMNNSGKAVKQILDYYKIPASKLTIIYDDVDLELGTFKTTGKSSAGHKGVQSIFDYLKTEDIARFRLGLRTLAPQQLPTDIFVLQKFDKLEQKIKSEVITNVVNQIIL